MGDSSASDSSALSKHEVQHDDFRKLTAQALMTNARFWLSQFSSEPLPEESEIPFERLVSNGKLLAQLGAALVKSSKQGLAVVPALQMRAAEAWEAPVGAARAGRVADDAAAFVAACRTLGVRSVECCSALDITHPGPSSTRAVCVTLFALSTRCKALGLRVAPFPVADLSFPSEDTKERTAALHRLASADSLNSNGASSQRPSPRYRDTDRDALGSSVTSLPPPADAAAYVVPPNVQLPQLESGPVLPPDHDADEDEDEVSSGLLLPPPAAVQTKPPPAPSPPPIAPPQPPRPRASGSPLALPVALSKAAASGGVALVLLHLLRSTGSPLRRHGAFNGRLPPPTGTPFGGSGEHLIVWRRVSPRDVRQRANRAR